ncbi:hypothetical protein [Sulfitobacter sp. SK012]|uniref:hypothetical protein n=1 Tax=Sulfitobacter sp. SK012 TaxID=1389005 RepID=UPI0013B3EF2C|nr:hypothetical protein [Sulfitobacter sp. SK012]
MRPFAPPARNFAMIVAASLVFSGQARADGFCNDLHIFAKQAVSIDHDVLVPPSLMPNSAPPTCGTSRGLSGNSSVHCYWAFDYRSKAARMSFERLHADVSNCAGPSAAPDHEASVNHPDSYQLHQFELDQDKISISLKDKGALQKTLVFLRIERAPKS